MKLHNIIAQAIERLEDEFPVCQHRRSGITSLGERVCLSCGQPIEPDDILAAMTRPERWMATR